MSENGLARFVRRGAIDANARLTAALAPRKFSATDRYLWTSVVVDRFDRVTHRLRDWWLASESGGAVLTVAEAWQREHWVLRYQTIAIVLLAATAAHVVLTLIQGARPGWFWLVVPGMVVLLAVPLLIASRAHRSTL
jgi:hypothetical protein